MNYFSFLSMTRPGELGYRVERETDFDYRSKPAIRWAKMYMTYGDGNCQHSKETTFARELLPDFLGSLANAIATASEPERASMLEIVAKHWPRQQNTKQAIRFALSLKCKEKAYYYNLADRKVSSAASKYHDKRWERIDPRNDHIDGSILSAALILKAGDCYDDVHAIQAYQEIDEVFDEDNDYNPFKVWEHFQLAGNRGWAENAWRAVAYYVQSWRFATDAADLARRWAEYGIEKPEEAKTA